MIAYVPSLPSPRGFPRSRKSEYQYCSRRGVCDFETGRCECADGFSQANCDVADWVITEDFDKDVHLLYSTMNNFTGKLFHVVKRHAPKRLDGEYTGKRDVK